MSEQLVYVATRLEAEEDDTVIGVWGDEEKMLQDLKDQFEIYHSVWVENYRAVGQYDDTKEEFAYITRCVVQ